jgi:hypothetical protein
MKANVAPMTLVALLLWTLSPLPAIAQTAERSRAQMIEHGKYLVLLGHCNNCPTAGYIAAAGKGPEERWLMGNPVGWCGKNGTTYAINLRLYMQKLSEEGWMQTARTVQPRPPMPWWSLRDTTDDDLKAM